MSQPSRSWRRGRIRVSMFLFLSVFKSNLFICYAVFYLYSIVTVFVSSFMKCNHSNLNSPRFLDMSHIDNYRSQYFSRLSLFKEALTNSIICGHSRCKLVQVPLAVLQPGKHLKETGEGGSWFAIFTSYLPSFRVWLWAYFLQIIIQIMGLSQVLLKL